MIDFKKFKLDYYFAFAILIGIVYTFAVSGVVSEFESLPSPIFGGDYYFQLGSIHHMYESSVFEWFASGNMLGALPAYLPFYGIMVTIFGKLFSLSPMDAMLDFNLILPIISIVISFLFVKDLFKSSQVALLGSLLFVSLTSFPILKYTDFTSLILVPLFFYSLWIFYKEQNQKSAIILGIVFAIMGLAHTTSFAYAASIIFLMFCFILLQKYLSNKEEFVLMDEVKKISPLFAYSFILGFIISLVIWFEPIFIHHGQSTLGNNIWTTPDVKVFSIGLGVLISNIRSVFFNFNSITSIIVSLFTILGLYFMVKSPSKDSNYSFIVFLFVSSLLLIHSYFVTSPLFDFHLVPEYMSTMYLAKVGFLVALFFVNLKLKPSKHWKIIFVVLVALMLFNTYDSYESWLSNEWFESGKSSLPEPYLELQTYLLENTNVNDVILSNNELSFMINSLSGRKLVVSRRSQNDPFMDFDQRELDAAVIFYGNNLNQKLELLEKYNVDYLYVDVNWFDMEYAYNSDGNVVDYSDPMMLIYSEENEMTLIQNGIEYADYFGWVDPAIRGDKFRKYNLLLITPSNYDFEGYGPWKTDLDAYLTPVWDYESQGEKVIVLYKVTI